MNKRKNLEITLAVSTLIVILMFIAGVGLNLFSGLSWYDEIVHFLAGSWGGVIVIWIFTKYKEKIPFYSKFKKSPVLFVVLAMILIGIGWEIFEFLLVEYAKIKYNYRIVLQPSQLDTLTDLIFDGLGGWLSAFKLKSKYF